MQNQDQTALLIPDRGIFNVFHFWIYTFSHIRALPNLDKITHIYIDYDKASAQYFGLLDSVAPIVGGHAANTNYRIAKNNVNNFVVEALSMAFPNAIIENSVANCPPNCMRVPNLSNGPDGYAHPDAYVFIRNIFMPHIKRYIQTSPKWYSPFIYISRNFDSDRRRILNEDALFEQCAALQKFQRISTSDFVLIDEMAVFNRAKVIIAGHGACLVNTLFCEPGTTVIEINSDYLWDHCEFRHIIESCNLQYIPYRATRHPNPIYGGDRLAENLSVDNLAEFNALVARAVDAAAAAEN